MSTSTSMSNMAGRSAAMTVTQEKKRMRRRQSGPRGAFKRTRLLPPCHANRAPPTPPQRPRPFQLPRFVSRLRLRLRRTTERDNHRVDSARQHQVRGQRGMNIRRAQCARRSPEGAACRSPASASWSRMRLW
ncbi:uncharacterized protein LOC113566746 [Drosophila persimilis]|uniref:uncharacterized protein LOC113566746 n=1 Tax=Drosophila persimilis TaxID=7234 RepID=UPI000F099554|nr:uncharacterized protein LOC113566746 [Drosophila persimilis]